MRVEKGLPFELVPIQPVGTNFHAGQPRAYKLRSVKLKFDPSAPELRLSSHTASFTTIIYVLIRAVLHLRCVPMFVHPKALTDIIRRFLQYYLCFSSLSRTCKFQHGHFTC
jgi:hypothetical protein